MYNFILSILCPLSDGYFSDLGRIYLYYMKRSSMGCLYDIAEGDLFLWQYLLRYPHCKRKNASRLGLRVSPSG
jgi:hypothetical protein